MGAIDELVKNIKRQTEQARQAQIRYVECTAVDWPARTMTAKGTADDVEYLDVSLGLGSTYVKPAVGSVCLIGITEGQEVCTFLIAAQKAELVETNADEIEYNGGQNGGLVKVNELVSRINAVEQDLNTIKTVFAAWQPVPNDGGSVLQKAAFAWSGQQLRQTTREDIENDKIRH